MWTTDERSSNAERMLEIRRGFPNDKDSPGRYNHVKFAYIPNKIVIKCRKQ